MALLALLQHHGAATPLLDVSLDPMLALYMAVVSPNGVDDDKDGALFAIRRPEETIEAFDSRTFAQIYTRMPGDHVELYSAPDVSERLRIQRGHFLFGHFIEVDARVTIPLTIEPESTTLGESWLGKRMASRGGKGAPPAATTEVGVFRIASSFKKDLAGWLEARTGLTREFVFPTTWHRPHLDRFAQSHGRTARF